jgi:hypothetical protein
MVASKPLKRSFEFARWKSGDPALNELQTQGDDGKDMTRTPRIALELEFHLSCARDFADQAQGE